MSPVGRLFSAYGLCCLTARVCSPRDPGEPLDQAVVAGVVQEMAAYERRLAAARLAQVCSSHPCKIRR